MYLLTNEQLDTLRGHLRRSGVPADLLPELTDHLACDLEEALWEGCPFEEALQMVTREASLETLSQLQEEYCDILGLEPEPATLTDIVFMNRNKLYGAYDLRQNYPVATERALLYGFLLFSAAVFAMSWVVNANVQRERQKAASKIRFVEPAWLKEAGKPTLSDPALKQGLGHYRLVVRK